MSRKKKTNLNTNNDKSCVNLLWTGGWDSTFRLLQLLFKKKVNVQPHYLMRSEQQSGKEIDTMVNIRRHLSRQHPEIGKLLHPLIINDSKSVYKYPEIEKLHQNLSEKKKVNYQYKLLACYCREIDVSDMELSIIALEKDIVHSKLFDCFSLPLLDKTKLEMYEDAKNNDWMDIMEMTWFCRRPVKGKPCGFCGPCTDVLDMGMGWRLPLKARVIANLQLPFRKWWRNNYEKQSNGPFKKLFELLKHRV